jgi:hypothetical protein
MGRTFGRVLAVLLLVLVAAGIGTWVYNAGVSAGLAEAAVQATASGEPVPPGAWGWGHAYGPYAHGPWGFGFFGILFGILLLFLVIGLVRAAFGGGWGHGGPGSHHGRHAMLEEMHRDFHRREAEAGGAHASGA